MSAAFGFLSETIALHGGSEALLRRATIILDEVCSNMMRHDDSLTEASRFTLELLPDGAGVTMIISDCGRVFDPLAHCRDAPPDLGGHGIVLIRGLALDVTYQRIGVRNRLTVTVASGDG